MLFEQHVALPSFTFISSYTKMSYCDVNMLYMLYHDIYYRDNTLKDPVTLIPYRDA